MNAKKVTITDVAREAGVSIATVSRVMNEPAKVDLVSQKKVRLAMAKLEYVPSPKKEQNRMFPCKLLVLIIPTLDNPFFSRVAEGVLAQADKENLKVVVLSCHGDAKEEESCLLSAAALLPRAVLFCPLAEGSSDLVHQLFPPNFPLVILYRRDYLEQTAHIYYNNILGGYLATKYLLKGGHTQIAFFISFWEAPGESVEQILENMGHANQGSYSSLDRLAGYLQALDEYNIPLNTSLICTTSYEYQGGYEMAKKFLSSLKDFDSIICCNDSVAAGVLQALGEQNIHVPGQISVIGYDDGVLAGIARPQLTSIHQDSRELGIQAVNQIVKLLEGEIVQDVVLEPYLTIRNSTSMRKIQ